MRKLPCCLGIWSLTLYSFSKSADVIDDSDEELERLERLEEERLRLSRAVLDDEADEKSIRDVEMDYD